MMQSNMKIYCKKNVMIISIVRINLKSPLKIISVYDAEKNFIEIK